MKARGQGSPLLQSGLEHLERDAGGQLALPFLHSFGGLQLTHGSGQCVYLVAFNKVHISSRCLFRASSPVLVLLSAFLPRTRQSHCERMGPSEVELRGQRGLITIHFGLACS